MGTVIKVYLNGITPNIVNRLLMVANGDDYHLSTYRVGKGKITFRFESNLPDGGKSMSDKLHNVLGYNSV